VIGVSNPLLEGDVIGGEVKDEPRCLAMPSTNGLVEVGGKVDIAIGEWTALAGCE
jgi:hypothetical protein